MRTLSSFLATVGLFLSASLLPVGRATTYLALGPYEVLARADAVLLATVEDVTAEVRDDRVWTTVSLGVTEWLEAFPAPDEQEDDALETDALELRFLGGEADGRRLLVAGTVAWQVGDEVLLAVNAEEGAASPLVGFRQGYWQVREGSVVDADGRYLTLDLSGRLVRADAPSASAGVLTAVRSALTDGPPEAPLDPAEEDGPDNDAPDTVDAEPDGDGGEGDESENDAPAADEAGDPAEPATQVETVRREYSVDDSGGPLLLSDRLAAAEEAWESVAAGAIELVASAGSGHAFAYGDESLFGPDTITLSLAEGGEIDVLVRPDEGPAVEAALRHELGVLLGLGPAGSGVMSMAIEDDAVAPGAAELAELTAISAFAPADLDRDGVVGFGDLIELAAAYGRGGLNLPADLDGDGDVDDDDVEVLRQAYTFAPPLGAAEQVDEPQTDE